MPRSSEINKGEIKAKLETKNTQRGDYDEI